MRLTDKEKLERAIEFIKSIEQLDLPTIDILDLVNPYCSECGCNVDVECDSRADYIEAKELDVLKDKAWHLLADLA